MERVLSVIVGGSIRSPQHATRGMPVPWVVGVVVGAPKKQNLESVVVLSKRYRFNCRQGKFCRDRVVKPVGHPVAKLLDEFSQGFFFSRCQTFTSHIAPPYQTIL